MDDLQRYRILERHGWVNLWAEQDDLTVEDILCSHEDAEECHERTRETVERDGIQRVTGWYTVNPEAADCWTCQNEGPSHDSHTWHHADSVGGFAGFDWKGSGYDDDIKAETARQFIAAWRGRVIDRKSVV